MNFPEALVQAQRDDNLVIFAGAGVSVDAPSSLPLFDELARQIAIQLDRSPTKKELKNPDRFLGVLSEKNEVHQLAARLIAKEGSAPNALHHSILRASTAGGSSLRLVTTNYDLHFSTAAKLDEVEAIAFDAPSLPMGDDFTGIVHLHGSLRQEARRMVLTDKDFGRAYLTGAWAAQFLFRMFNSYTVLFVGYSHSDAVMDYLARGLSSDSKKRYALTPDNDFEKWRRLEIVPIPYPLVGRGRRKYVVLKTVVEQWGSRTSMGLLDHRQRISELVSAPPPEDPVDADYLGDILTSPTKAAFFTEFARGESWLAWVENQPAFRELFTDSHHVQIELLAPWFVQHFVLIESNTRRALKTIQTLGGRIGPPLWRSIALGLFQDRTNISSELFQPWIALLIDSAPAETSDVMDYLLNKCEWPRDRSSALLLLDYLLTPRIDLAPTFQLSTDHLDTQPWLVRPEISLRGSEYWLSGNWERVFKPHLNEVAVETARMAAIFLFKAHSMLVAFSAANDKWDPLSFSRSAIEPHDQDQYPNSTGVLIDIARDSVVNLLMSNSEVGSGYVAEWSESKVPLLRRLAVHAWNARIDKTADEKMTWLLSEGRLFDIAAKHEIFNLIQVNLASSSLELRNSMVNIIFAGAPEGENRAYTIYNFLVWLAFVDPDLTSATEALAQFQNDHPEFGPREHPDLDHWFTSGTPLSAFPMTVDELHRRLSEDAQGAFREILSFFDADRFGHSEWEDALERISAVVAEWPDDGHVLLFETDIFSPQAPGLWRAVINGWDSAQLNEEQWSAVIASLRSRPVGSEVNRVTSRLLERGSKSSEMGFSLELLNAERELAKSLWKAEEDTEIRDLSSFGWYGHAINSSAGALAEFWVHSISREWRAAGDDWAGIDGNVAEEISSMLIESRPCGAAARAIFGSQLLFLFGADEAWCKAALLPLFKWGGVASEFTRQVWDGYLRVGRWNEKLLHAGFLDSLVNTAIRVESELPTLIDRCCENIASVALYSEMNPLGSDWLTHFIASASPITKHSWAHRIGILLSVNTVELAEKRWIEWIKSYWKQRTLGIPTPLDSDEASAMAGWTPFFGAKFPEAVELSKAVPAPLKSEDLLIHRLIKYGVVSAYPQEVISLLTHLLSNTPAGGEFEYELSDCVVALWENSDARSLRPLVEAAIRAGYQDAATWIDLG